MKKYYIHNGVEQLGPFDLEELKTKSINNDTPIWYEGIENWTSASKIVELKELFETKIPPPYNPSPSPPRFEKLSKPLES